MRIIPARAGFTPRSSATPTPKEDHPRSRGVYTARASSSWLGRGSSPLARGLPRSRRGGGGCPRIIPARAGFTAKPPTASWPPSDHPRSRGVYPITIKATIPSEGSSPLARGLRMLRSPTIRRARIIPARAGFTPRISPRQASQRGSSPLARGLQHPHQRSADEGGIIPARAGFTCPDRRSRAHAGDHPRSRGVYTSRRRQIPRTEGSSPLARGLLFRCHTIPEAALDHPRSRGVYRGTAPSSARGTGSSPLARGLRGGRPSASQMVGIIPARAGFTRARVSHWRRSQDHPRSRGVYPARRRPRSVGGWIIPARAGFTTALTAGFNRLKDHPRSRGVYIEFTGLLSFLRGSSPLARGLLGSLLLTGQQVRIIPARAGFTSGTP